ncbi:MAG: DUF4974 domain-containing protein [Prevotella sp.]|nr:DUF4974 domain-containing protein [Prevotella sp.]
MNDIQQEDKLTQVLEAVEHPERYTDEQLRQLLSDEECADYYRMMCDAASAYADTQEVSEAETEAAWQQIRERRPARILTLRRIAAVLVVILLLSGFSFAAIQWMQDHTETPDDKSAQAPIENTVAADGSQTVATDSVWTFQNAELQEILTEVAAYYQLRTEYRHEETRHVRFYIKWNKAEPVQPIVERLNLSEKVNITLADDLLIVE